MARLLTHLKRSFWGLILVCATASSAVDLSIQSADLTSQQNGYDLAVSGFGPEGSRVSISNADTGSTLGRIRVNRSGQWSFEISGLLTEPCRIQATTRKLTASAQVSGACLPPDDSGDNSGGSGGGGSTPAAGDYLTLAINDLGMHCADLDYQVFSILPPYNVLHSQVIRKGTSRTSPRILTKNEVDVYYQAVPSQLNTSQGVIEELTSTSRNVPVEAGLVYKGNFWQPTSEPDADSVGSVLGGDAYNSLYHGLLTLNSALLPDDRGLPAPELEPYYLKGEALTIVQQNMPGLANEPQKFAGYVQDLPFFTRYQDSFGYIAEGLNRHTAEGIPILPITDNGWENPYPMMAITAVLEGKSPDAANALATMRVTLPVASEADCQGCHATDTLCNEAADALPGVRFSCGSVVEVLNDTDYEPLSSLVEAPGATAMQRLLNAAKINILRLHDARHATRLDEQRAVVCATCHYSPALDLAHLGPNDEAGKEQTQHNSMSNVMHAYHAQIRYLDGEPLFPIMPPPSDDPAHPRSGAGAILQETCYNCHPGKRTKCMRGAMSKAGIVCQDCHGQLAQVGDDLFSGGDRVPWANEPGCQSCHTGDAVDNLTQDPQVIVAADGIRLLQAYRKNDLKATPILAMNRIFAETLDSDNKNHLYRLSKGHGGVMCEGCHGSTHAVWPNPNPEANDNLSAIDLQGHSGTLTECDACHAPGSLGLTMKGPHGMHPVNDTNWTKNHKTIAEHNAPACTGCHGAQGEGTVLARVAVDRQAICKDEKGSLCRREGDRPIIPKGTEVSCTLCHGNYILED